MSKLVKILVAVGVLTGCDFKWQPDRASEDDGADRQNDDLGSIEKQPSAAVCNGGAFRCYAQIRTDASGAIRPYVGASGIGPADLKSAYKLPATGSTATIAIVDAFHYPNAESDLAQYRSNYGLPPCTKANGCFTVVNQNGQASPLPGTAPAGDDWTVEAALDLDLASAACPTCKLILVEAQDDQGDGLFVAQNGAASLGAAVISDSWGGPESGSELSSDSMYFNHPGIAIFVASGDAGNTGSSPDYPSTSAHVTAVGGTSLVKSSNARGWTEGAWSSGGSSCSKSIAKPSYQTSSACSHRMTADVSAVGDPNTGLAVFNAANGGWIVVGGTSASSPFVAGVYALTGHGGDAPSFAYSHASSYFDITTGKNGSCGTVLCNAGAGWDGPTGIGSPNGQALAGGTCTPQCTGKMCGPDGCGGSCGMCGTNETCSAAGQCETNGCTPQCSGKMCGPDGCGGQCGVCTNGATCDSTGQCSGGGGTCSHPICSTGGELAGCGDPCAQQICARDSYCCSTAWDSICVGEVGSVCGQSCGGGGCAHPVCSTGTKLTSGCSSCATKICSADPYCCNTKWDSQCVGEVSSICNQSCN